MRISNYYPDSENREFFTNPLSSMMATIGLRPPPSAVLRKWALRLVLASAAFFLVGSWAFSSLSDWLFDPSATSVGFFTNTSGNSSFFSGFLVSPANPRKESSSPSSDFPSPSLADFREQEPIVYPVIEGTPTAPPSRATMTDNSIDVDTKPPSSPATEGTSNDAETPLPRGDSMDRATLTPKAPFVLAKVDEELIYAKKEIEQSPIVLNDPELYTPLFRNVSVFKRSYELMEKILKVYIYDDGQSPIFHTPLLQGIYASEGWFLKLMEENVRFTVKDPNQAHLFFLPYSARQLELALYKPNSHNMKPLLIFLKNYVNTLSLKYPFWNRTKGSDHFIVACHDWGPYTTKLHEEFRKNTIKALCNADVSEGVFIRGKDVSLPETNVRMPKHPIKDIGGNRVSQRPILAFFAGQMHGRVRPILLDYWRGKDDDMKIYGPLPKSLEMSYVQHMKSSKYCICPMGYEVNSPRIVEAIYYECVPVIIADNFVLPFEEVLDWSAFSIVIAEKDIPKLKDILNGISLRRYVYLQANVKKLQKHFLWHHEPIKYDIFHMILHSIWFNRLNQIQNFDYGNAI